MHPNKKQKLIRLIVKRTDFIIGPVDYFKHYALTG